MRERRAVTDAALAAVGESQPERFLVARAERLLERSENFPPRLPRLPVVFVVLAALVVGLMSNLVGGRRIQLLWNPVLALVAWSLLVYLLLVVRKLRARRSEPARAVGMAALLAGQSERVRERVARRLSREQEGSGSRLFASASSAFLEAWTRASAALRLARASYLLHLGAALVALGALCGMYVRGLVVEYRATWESTFLGESAQRRVLSTLLAPALAIRGEELPNLADIEAPADGPAAPWLHRYAWTVVLFVLLPRGVLAALDARRARRLAANVIIDGGQPYFRRLLAPARGEASVAFVLPYARALTGGAGDRLADLLADHLGARASVRTLAPLEYGAEMEELPRDGDGARRTLVLVFPLGQPPESEVHGRLLHELRESLAEGDELVVLVDATGYRERLGSQAEDRVAERQQSWDRVLRAEKFQAVHLDLGALDADEALTRLTELAS